MNYKSLQDFVDALERAGELRRLTKEHLFCYYPNSMSIWDRLLYLIGLRPTPGPRTYHFDASESLQVTLATLSTDEGRPETDLIPDILAAGLTQYTGTERLWNTWETLSPRERDVTALVCLGYTNREIGMKVHISPESGQGSSQNCISQIQSDQAQ